MLVSSIFSLSYNVFKRLFYFRAGPMWLSGKRLTRNPGVLSSSLTGSSGFFRGNVLGQDTSEPSLVLVKPRKA